MAKEAHSLPYWVELLMLGSWALGPLAKLIYEQKLGYWRLSQFSLHDLWLARDAGTNPCCSVLYRVLELMIYVKNRLNVLVTVHLVIILSDGIEIREVIGLMLHIVCLLGTLDSRLLQGCLDPGTDRSKPEADLGAQLLKQTLFWNLKFPWLRDLALCDISNFRQDYWLLGCNLWYSSRT